MRFDQLKKRALSKLEKAVAAGEADEPVLPYLELINRHPDYFTSSSCYGRTIFIHIDRRKDLSRFLGKWHRKISFEEAWETLQNVEGNVWFRFDPLILHISCRNIDAAKKVLEIKTSTGFKRGGIFSIKPERVQIELEGTDMLAAPVKSGKEILVSEDYFKTLVEKANQKFESNERKWKKFGSAWEDYFSIHT